MSETEKVKELKKLYSRLLEAMCPEDIFEEIVGTDESEKKECLRKKFILFSKIAHPNAYPGTSGETIDIANQTFTILEDFRNRAEGKIENGSYGDKQPTAEARDDDFIIKTRKREYTVRSDLFMEGDIAHLFKGECAGTTGLEGKIVVKVTIDAVDNDFAQNEINILKIFQAETSNQSKHLPYFLDSFKTQDDQIGLIIRYFDGFDFNRVRKSPFHKNGVDAKSAAWMMARALSVLGYVHSLGIVHGNIEPSHILIRPRDHNLMLADWSYATLNPKDTGDGFKVVNEEFSPPEVAQKLSPLPSSDLYSLGKSFIYLVGGDTKARTMPATVPKKFQDFLKALTLPSPIQRLGDAWDAHNDLMQIRKELWVPIKFEEFTV